MNIVLWIIQGLLALHTAIGGIWKFGNSEIAVPSLSVIPHSVWVAMGVIELLCALGLLLPVFRKSLGSLVPLASLLLVVEMLFFCVLHLKSGATDYGPMIYWLVVALISGGLAFVRCKIKPIRA